MVEQTPRGRHHDVATTIDLLQLTTARLPTVHRHRARTGQVAEFVEFIADLRREFARGRDHQDLHTLDLRIEPVHRRQAERRGFAGAGLGLSDEVTTRKNHRNCL